MKTSQFQTVVENECPRVRIATGSVAAVDRCGCGMFQLHLGAFTLRLAPEALSSLVATLGEAVAAGAFSFSVEASNDGSGRWSQS